MHAGPFSAAASKEGPQSLSRDRSERGRAKVLGKSGCPVYCRCPLGPRVQELDGATLADVDSFFASNPNFDGGGFVGAA
jgi:hypothetical protein